MIAAGNLIRLYMTRSCWGDVVCFNYNLVKEHHDRIQMVMNVVMRALLTILSQLRKDSHLSRCQVVHMHLMVCILRCCSTCISLGLAF